MDTLESTMGKKNLLDMLAYLLWEESAARELSDNHIKFGKKLYKEVLAELKSQASYWQNTSPSRFDFGTLNVGCQDLGNLYSMEKRLELLERRLAERE